MTTRKSIKYYQDLFLAMGLLMISAGVYLMEYMDTVTVGAIVGGLIGNGIVSCTNAISSIVRTTRNGG